MLAAFALVLSQLFPVLSSAAQPRDGDGLPGEAQVGEVLRDPDFGVTTRQAGLQRHVEMYQWTRDGSGYALEWRGARVDSSGFAPGHENPRQIPLREREWRAPVSLDGRPVPGDVLAALGKWQQFRPNFSALPGNMSATFQPEGDGLGSAENPLAPQVGDLRITWRSLVLPPLAERLVLRDGEWTLRETTAAPAIAGPDARAGVQPQRQSPRWPAWLLFAAAAAAVIVLGLVIARRRKP
ncbi:TMEM43 family protein [Luteimonas soli]|uniref:TMEM43 family protein n=1 Tax=Luteimonas soli TaxID=1648966 RepID=A0ABV7XMN3_9GAMM